MIPYGIIADCFKDRTIVPFLGSAASFVGVPQGAAALPSGAELATLLATKSGYPGKADDPLTKVSQFVEEGPGDRQLLLKTISTLFTVNVQEDYHNAFTQFLGGLEDIIRPKLIVTTNYDTLVERALQKAKIPYVSLCQVVKGEKSGRFLYYQSLEGVLNSSSIITVGQVNEVLNDMNEADPSPTILYKMHGTARMVAHFEGKDDAENVDSIVLTENDYIEFMAQDRLRKIPEMVLKTMRLARLLFLGYSLEDWNFRVLLRRIKELQQQRSDEKRHWACLLNTDAVERGFWEKRGVNVYDCQLDAFLGQLSRSLSNGN